MTEIEQLDDGCVLVKVRMWGGCTRRCEFFGIWWIQRANQLREAIVRSCKEAAGLTSPSHWFQIENVAG